MIPEDQKNITTQCKTYAPQSRFTSVKSAFIYTEQVLKQVVTHSVAIK